MTEMRRVERLVEDLLALARLDEGVGPALREVEVGAFLRELAERRPAGRRGRRRSSQGTIRLDPDLIAQVVRNLLENARRHAGPGGPGRVSLGAGGGRPAGQRRRRRAGHPARPSASASSTASTAASPRATAPPAAAASGSAIARSIVELHGGRIWVEDSPLGGARVCFELPGFSARR